MTDYKGLGSSEVEVKIEPDFKVFIGEFGIGGDTEHAANTG